MSDLPKGWIEVPLSEILISLESGSRPKGGVRGIKEGIPSIGGEHLNERGGFNLDKIKYVPKNFAEKMTKGKIKKKDILIVKDGATTGKVSFVDNSFPFNDAVINEHVFICRTFSDINSKYVFRFLFSEKGQKRILANFKGSAQGGINLSFAPNTSIPLPPLNEQKQIVEKLDKLLAKVEAAKERLDKIPGILKKYRQSVLHTAVTGELTKDWREERRLLENWDFIRLGDYAVKIGSGATPRGGKSSYRQEGIPLIRSMNVYSEGFKKDGLVYLNENQAYALRNVEVRANDVLLNITGASIGRVCIAPVSMNGARVNQHVCIIRPASKITNKFLQLYLSAPQMQDFINKENYGVTRQALTKQIIENFKIPMPLIEEQKEIVNRVEKLLSKADEIEARYKKAKEYTDKLSQSILAKAFRGELVPQDPNDPPASKLLEKIK